RISKAKDVVFNRVVAVKTLKEPHNKDPQAIKAFIEECRLNARLDHPSIVPIYAMGRGDSGNWEAVMKLINGSSLNRFIKELRATYETRNVSRQQERKALISRLEYFLKTCEVIEYCHSLKIVHGDIKPGNILMGQFGEVYVMDWGCAKSFGTTPKRLSGTPNYLPPEFISDRKITPLIDVFSLGMLLFEMVTLYRGMNVHTLTSTGGESTDLSRRNVHDPSDYRHFLDDMKIDRQMEAIIRKSVNPDPAKRYQSVRDLANDVRHYIYDEEVKAAPDNFAQKLFRIIYRNRVATILITGAIIFVCSWLFLFYYDANLKEQKRTANLMMRLKFQSYTDNMAKAVEKNFLLGQAQLLMFADNLIDESYFAKENSDRFYDNSDYRDHKTAPPGMVSTPIYARSINLNYMVRFLPDKHVDDLQELPGEKRYVDICKKIICYDLSSHDVNKNRSISDEVLRGERLIQRLFVRWADMVEYSYPGTYEDVDSTAFKTRWQQLDRAEKGKKIIWSRPYYGSAGTLRINCHYPMYDSHDKNLGVAGVELRVDKLFDPIKEKLAIDPNHEFYYVDANNAVMAIHANGSMELLVKNEALPDKISAGKIISLAEQLRITGHPQLEVNIGGVDYFVSDSPLETTDGILIQIIALDKMMTHEHKD
ncbi:MAG: protein kinase, partial [Victivallales bacterium]|nr:protein kinase [Victivallales bacterium]